MNDDLLATQCRALAEHAANAAQWVNDNPDVVRSERDGLEAVLRRTGRMFRQCEVAARRKMCAGVFGPSQAGKSYLISALARDANGKLLADFAGQDINFISEINPEGGKESTGLVTRFTMTKGDPTPEGFPVRLRLLTETDLVKIVSNTYYADCEHKDVPNTAAILSTLEELEGHFSQGGAKTVPPQAVCLDEWEDLREYLIKDFSAKPRVQELERSFWARAVALGPYLDFAQRLKLYAVLWDGVEAFTELLKTLVGALMQLGNPTEAFASLDALIPRNNSIIDVAMLKDFDENGEQQGPPPPLTLVTKANIRAELPRSVVTALTAELTIVMREKPDDYFEHTDLLDFPGYRSRYKINDLRSELTKPNMTWELFLRGKVAYLFQRYCAERELTSMLLCIGPSNQDVQDLPSVINDWVLSTHGESPDKRRGKPVSLFFILTKFDLEFEDKDGAESVKNRWDNRLHASLLNFFGRQYDWPRIWDGEKSFNNMFLLRNPNFRFKAILTYDEQGQEVGVRESERPFVQALEEAFMQSELVAKHFVNPRQAWDAAMSLNDGGIGRIREQLRPLCNPDLKRQQLTANIKEYSERLATRLKPFWKSDDREEERRKKELFFQQIATVLANLAATQLLGEFVHNLMVEDHDLYDLYFEAERRMHEAAQGDGHKDSAVTASPASGAVPAVGATLDAKDILADIFGNDIPKPPVTSETVAQKESSLASQDQAVSFAALIESHWLEKMHKMANDPVYQQRYSLDGKLFSELISEIRLGAERLELRKHMEHDLRKAAGYANMQRERLIWKQVSFATARVNDYVAWLGYNPRTCSAKERTILVKGQPVVLFEPPTPIQNMPVIGEEPTAYERAWVSNWLRALMTLIFQNVDFDGEQIIDIEQNKRIGDIVTIFSQQ